MGLWDFLKKRKSASAATTPAGSGDAASPRTPEQVVQQALASQGIETGTAEVSELLNRLWKSIELKLVLPETLAYSNAAELEFTGSKYVVKVSMLLLDGGGHVSQDVMSMLLACAVYWACASEIAKAKGATRFALAEGQRIAVCDYGGFGEHPIYALFPDLLKKTVLR